MKESNVNENGVKKEMRAPGEKEGVSHDLFSKLLIQRIVGFLEQRPSDFAITILPPLPTLPEKKSTSVAERAAKEEDDEPIGSGKVPLSSLESLSTEQRSLLESSVVLMHEPEILGKTIGHLGLEAQNLPMVARVLRKAYRQAKTNLSQAASEPSQTETESLFRVTSCLLLIQPDHATAWADRRRCLLLMENVGMTANMMGFEVPTESTIDEDNKEDEKDASIVLWSRELDYLDMLFTQHSKAPSAWAHRKYTLRQILQRVKKHHHSHGNMEKTNKMKDFVFAREVKTCINVAEKYPKNYYAWTHRRYLWDLFASESHRTDEQVKKKSQCSLEQRQRFIQLLETELMIGMWQEWLPIHPADHSAVHYSCQVLDLLLNEMVLVELNDEHSLMEEKFQSVSVSALDQVRILLSKFSNENESLWIMRRITYNILWKHLCCPSIAEKFPEKAHVFNAIASSVQLLLRDDLKSILSSTLTFDSEDDRINGDSNIISNQTNIYTWTFLAWCMVNLRGIDCQRGEATNINIDTSRNDILFTPSIRERASVYLKSAFGTAQHNHLVYASPTSPISKSLATVVTGL